MALALRKAQKDNDAVYLERVGGGFDGGSYGWGGNGAASI
jgi:hypothetical protein